MLSSNGRLKHSWITYLTLGPWRQHFSVIYPRRKSRKNFAHIIISLLKICLEWAFITDLSKEIYVARFFLEKILKEFVRRNKASEFIARNGSEGIFWHNLSYHKFYNTFLILCYVFSNTCKVRGIFYQKKVRLILSVTLVLFGEVILATMRRRLHVVVWILKLNDEYADSKTWLHYATHHIYMYINICVHYRFFSRLTCTNRIMHVNALKTRFHHGNIACYIVSKEQWGVCIYKNGKR